MKVKIILFLLGGFFGFLVAALFQPLLRPALSEAFRGEEEVTEGRVVGKRLQGERLLLTVDAAEGTVLATFKQRVQEIDMLVEEGDLLKLGVRRYEPFVEDPPILSVRKQELPSAGRRAGEAEERRPQRPTAGIIPGAGRDADAPPEAEPEDEEPVETEERSPRPPDEQGEPQTMPAPEPPAGPPPATS